MNKLLAKVLFGGSVAASAAGGALFTPAPGTPIGEWFDALEKPPFNPPKAVFGPVWSVLYTLMAVSGYRVWRSTSNPEARRNALRLWSAQMAANAAWTPLFFGARRTKTALADLTILLALIGAYTVEAAKCDRTAAALFAPYLAWVSFAGALNFEFVRRNAA